MRISMFLTEPFNTNMERQTNHTLSNLIFKNLTHYHGNITSSSSNDFLLIFLDRSQPVMTIIGVIANIGTSITLFRNGQVSEMFFLNADNSSCGKVMFSQAFVIPSVHVRGALYPSMQWIGAVSQGCLPRRCLPRGVCPGGVSTTSPSPLGR